MKIIAKKREFVPQLLPAGAHVASIVSIAEASSSNPLWADATPQFEVKLRNDQGSITEWLNTKGYKKFDELTAADLSTAGQKIVEAAKGAAKTLALSNQIKKEFDACSSESGKENYAVSKTSRERVIDAERTAKAEEILADFAASCGIADDEEVSIAELVGSQVGIMVEATGRTNVKGNEVRRVKYFCSVERAEELLGATV